MTEAQRKAIQKIQDEIHADLDMQGPSDAHMLRVFTLHIAPQPAKAFTADARRFFPRGCTCTTGAGNCEFCVVEANGPEFAEVEVA